MNPYFAEDARWDPDQDGMSNLEEAWRGTDPKTANLARLTVAVQPSQGGVIMGAGILCPGSCIRNMQYDLATNLTAWPNPGFIFAGWEGCDVPQEGSCTSYLYGDKQITARFTKLYLYLPIILKGY